jgi:flavin reductase (DIM6/NTAB) family NADH-FMN oxidoreductase RutF
MMALAATEFDESFIPGEDNQRQMRDALGRFGTGVAIITALGTDEQPAAITVNSFSSVSLAPPLVLWCLDKHSSRYDNFANADHYAIHVLNAKQKDLCMDVARDPLRLNSLAPRNQQGVPVLDDCLARFDCQQENVYEAGDHVIILGRVMLVTTSTYNVPLAFFGGRTGAFSSHTL